MAAAGLDAFVVPRADAHQGEYVAPCDDTARLAYGLQPARRALPWCSPPRLASSSTPLHRAGPLPGRHRPFHPPCPGRRRSSATGWRTGSAKARGSGFDPWLHSAEAVEALEKRLSEAGIEAVPTGKTSWTLSGRTDRDGPPPRSSPTPRGDRRRDRQPRNRAAHWRQATRRRPERGHPHPAPNSIPRGPCSTFRGGDNSPHADRPCLEPSMRDGCLRPSVLRQRPGRPFPMAIWGNLAAIPTIQ